MIKSLEKINFENRKKKQKFFSQKKLIIISNKITINYNNPNKISLKKRYFLINIKQN
jgi:hypothetical protein